DPAVPTRLVSTATALYPQPQPRPPSATLFPYTTLFRSCWVDSSGWPPPSRSWWSPRTSPRPPGPSCTTTSATPPTWPGGPTRTRSEEHTSELQSQSNLVCRLLLEKKKAHDEAYSVPANE